MTYLQDCIKLYILKFLKNKELKKLAIANWCSLLNIKQQIKSNNDIKSKYFSHLKIHKFFCDTFLPIELIKKLPIIQYKKKFTGATHYIDGIRKKDMIKPIMIGVDRYRRPFLSIKYIHNEQVVEQYGEDIEFIKGEKLLTIFQRYTDDTYSWCKSGDTSQNAPLLLHTNILLSKYDKKTIIKNILELQEKLPISYPSYNYQGNRFKMKKMDLAINHN